MKPLLFKTGLVFVLLTLLGIFTAVFWYIYSLTPLISSAPAIKISFVITRNESATSVLNKLAEAKAIRSSLAAKLYLKAGHLENRLLPGGYVISPASSTAQIIRQLTTGPKDIWVTIPEGWRREQIAQKLVSVLSDPTSAFDPKEFLTQTATLEGRLFPDTYLISPKSNASDIIRTLVANFSKKTSPLDISQPDLIIASLVEREAKFDSDRATVASILVQRYKSAWPLQVDATVQYALDSYSCSRRPLSCQWWQPLPDTQFKSSYNTYLFVGLPPAPISNPGLASITAVKNAAPTPYWYYLHDTQGKAHFAQSFVGHQLNIDKYLRP